MVITTGAGSAQEDETQAPAQVPLSPVTDVLLAIDGVLAEADARPEVLSAVLGIRLSIETELSNAHFTIYRGEDTSSGPLSKVELRLGTANRDPTPHLVIVDLAESGCLTKAEVDARLGDGFAPRMPSMHAPPTTPVYYAKPIPGGELRVGFSPDDAACLRTIVVDRIEG